jgi:hypothetical protein
VFPAQAGMNLYGVNSIRGAQSVPRVSGDIAGKLPWETLSKFALLGSSKLIIYKINCFYKAGLSEAKLFRLALPPPLRGSIRSLALQMFALKICGEYYVQLGIMVSGSDYRIIEYNYIVRRPYAGIVCTFLCRITAVKQTGLRRFRSFAKTMEIHTS